MSNITEEVLSDEIISGNTTVTWKAPKWEKYAMGISGIALIFWGIGANGFVVYLTKKHHQFHKAYMYTRAGYAIVDIICIISSVPFYLWNVYYETMPHQVSCYIGNIGIGMFFTTLHLTALIALERYVFFCYPMRYHEMFNLRTITYTIISMILLSQVYMHGTEVIYGRQFQLVLFMCQLNSPLHNTIQVFMYYVPSMTILVLSTYKIKKLSAKISQGPSIEAATKDTMEPMLRKKATKKAIRLILLVSGSFWGTCIPLYLIRTITFNSGYTWDDLNSYKYPGISSAMRVGQIFGVWSAVFDPIIYYGVNKDLRVALARTFRINMKFSWEVDDM